MPWTAKNLVEVGQFFGVTHGTAKEWRRNGMPGEPSSFDLSEIYRWLCARRDASPTTQARTIDAKKELEVARLTEDVRARQRENEKEEGQLIDRRQVESELAIVIIDSRKIFEQLPAKLSPMLPREYESPITAEVRRLIYAALNELRDRTATIAPRAKRVAEVLERIEAPAAIVDRSSPPAELVGVELTPAGDDAAGGKKPGRGSSKKPATKRVPNAAKGKRLS